MASGKPLGYSAMQIILHWVIAALVIFQVLFGEMIGAAYRAFMKGETPADSDLSDARIHVYVGIAVLVLALWRLAIRMMRGVPALPEGESAVSVWIARITHTLLYLIILLMPVSGMVAWFGGVGTAGEVHHLMKPVIILVVVLHILGALWQQYGAKTGALTRMFVPERRG